MQEQEIPTFTLREQDAMGAGAMAAPAGDMGAPPTPGGGNTTNDEHMKRTAWHLNMEEEEFEKGIEGGTVTVYRPYDFSEKWGFHVSGPIEAMVEKRDDEDAYDVTFVLESIPQNKFYLPYGQNGQPVQYEGPHPNKTEVLSKSDIQNQMAAPLDPEAAQRGNAQPPETNPMEQPGMADSGAPGGGASDTGSSGLTPTG